MRRGQGTPLLLIHVLGGHWQSWETIIDDLAAEREIIAVDLPGFGETPPLSGEVSIATLADALEQFLDQHDLRGVDTVGSSMGARLTLELARRGAIGTAVALDPGGFWNEGERKFFGVTIGASIGLVRLLQPLLPHITGSALGRTLLLAQFSARPWRLAPHVVLNELRSYIASPSTDAALKALVEGPTQMGLPAAAQRAPIVIVWGRADRVCLPTQATRALEQFPGAHFQWLNACGHFPHWDRPQTTVRLILASTGGADYSGWR